MNERMSSRTVTNPDSSGLVNFALIDTVSDFISLSIDFKSVELGR